ncbi:hypothetical protein [Dyadobacter frigoris]|uniref:Outer membrane protein beta-barrel domain-containing protein n=1 Tax=Dyadobacter frigoris TaxID=2576211 RepID=A0A4U6D548_9BACT|nr:hypothetical protein [Dyadobacter frigoris]TKT92460.1 hypothetical protein FDK13_10860 [Dyadobacter frigoris]GLU55246.1 hypothetical protein Dfri01_47070 [Dyadobacter frigoris]
MKIFITLFFIGNSDSYKVRAILILFASLSYNYQLKAQSYLLDKSKNASFVSASIGSDDWAVYKTAAIGYSVNGRFDMVLAGIYESGSTAKAYTITPALSYLVVKQDKLPLSIGLFAGYGFKNFNHTKDLKNYTIKTGISLYHKIKIRNNVLLIPGLFCGQDFTKTRLDDYTNRFSTRSAGIQTTLLIKNFSITPQFSYTQLRGSLFTLQAGLILFKSEFIQPVNEL